MSSISEGQIMTTSSGPSNKSRVLSEGRTASFWVSEFASRGVKVSERRLKELARSFNCYCPFTEPMLLLPEHLDQIFMEEQKCRSNSTGVEKLGGSKAKSTSSQKATIIAKAREKLNANMQK